MFLTSHHRGPGFGRQKQRGISMVELLVGAAIGMLLAVWATGLFVTSLGNNRTLMAEARVNQGLRAAADLIVRDLRRAGYWGNAIAGTVTGTGALSSVTTTNPYRAIAADDAASSIGYNFARDTDDALASTEQFGFRLSNNVVQMQTSSGSWVDVTDPTVLVVTAMTITPTETVLDIGHACPNVCSVAITPSCPTVTVRSYGIVLQGRYAKDDAITRTLRTNVRVRNDALNGVCPA